MAPAALRSGWVGAITQATTCLKIIDAFRVIRYRVAEVPGGVAFTSEPAPGPGFRLSYLKKGEGLVTVRFEIAPPSKPEAFWVYLEALTRKTK